MKHVAGTTPNYEVDLTSCDREPIHQLGAVQSFGFLVAVSTDWIVARVSENIGTFLEAGPDDMIGRSLGDVLPAETMHALRGMTQGLRGTDAVERTFGLDLTGDDRLYDVAMYLSGRHLVVEAEPSERDGVNIANMARSMIARLQAKRDFAGLTREAVRQMRALTGFDRVMMYRFDEDGSGQVIAEAHRSALEPYLNLRFPASDIPKQARALYERNMLRLIHDTSEFGAAIVPRMGADGEPLDLSMSVLRAVSPIHLEYLTNMGVRASMSVSIMVNGKLWGLFACHHMQPCRVPLERRSAAELFGQMASWVIDARLRDDEAEYENRSGAVHDRLMSTVAARGATMDALLDHLDELPMVISSDGVGLWIDGRAELRGVTPTREEFTGLIRHLHGAPAGEIFTTPEIGRIYEPGSDFADRAAGILAIPVSRKPRDYLVFFRREVARTVRWAGDPNKPVTQGPNGARLTPRKSFAAWQEIVRGQSAPWTPTDIRIAEGVRTMLLEVILRMSDAAEGERRVSQDRQELLIAELNHRVRNILGLIRGLITQTKGGAETVADFAEVIGGRVQALARAHDQVTTNNWGPGSLTELVRSEASAYLSDHKERVRFEGTDVLLEPQAFSTIALVVHELMTNAAKYGALVDNSGHVVVSWGIDGLDRLALNWREVGGPPVQAPSRKGFGSTIIDRSIPFDLKGKAEVDFNVTGLEARFVIPAAYVRRAEPMLAPVSVAEEVVPANLSGRVLLVEDNMLIALDAEDMLLELGAERVDTAISCAMALDLVAENEPTFALLDVNLGTETSIPIAEELARRGVPFVFATGYGDKIARPAAIEDAPIVTKPYNITMIRTFLGKLR